MENKLRKFAEKIYHIVENADAYFDAVEDLEDALKLMPVNIKEGITDTRVSITDEGIVVEPNIESPEFDESHALDLVMNAMVEDLMEEEGVETTDDLIKKLNKTA